MRLLVNDYLTTIPNVRTFWHDLMDWYDMEPVMYPYQHLADVAEAIIRYAEKKPSMLLRNASYFRVIRTDVPQMCFLQDINLSGPVRDVQDEVLESCKIVVFNNPFTADKYNVPESKLRLAPLSIDFERFVPLEKLPDDRRVCWTGASQGADGRYKGWGLMQEIIRDNPDMTFVTAFKDAMPDTILPNQEAYCRIPHDQLVALLQSCQVGLCTSDPNGSPVENQHLAGIEMGACGLPLVAPRIGNYWHRTDMPGVVLDEWTSEAFSEAIEHVMRMRHDPTGIHNYWRLEFDREVIKGRWKEIIEETESMGGAPIWT